MVAGGDPVLSTHPLDIMWARGQISEKQNEAGWAYYKLRRSIVGHAEPKAARLEEYIGAGSIADSYVEDVERDGARWETYFRAERELHGTGGHRYRVTRDLIFGNMPRPHLISEIRSGLDILVSAFGLGKRRG